jgi:hypothetical protein
LKSFVKKDKLKYIPPDKIISKLKLTQDKIFEQLASHSKQQKLFGDLSDEISR